MTSYFDTPSQNSSGRTEEAIEETQDRQTDQMKFHIHIPMQVHICEIYFWFDFIRNNFKTKNVPQTEGCRSLYSAIRQYIRQ